MIKQVAYFAFGTFVIGIAGAIIFMLIILIIPPLTFQMAYEASLFIPNKLGILEEVSQEDLAIANTNNVTLIELSKSGRYRIYSQEPIANHTTITLTSQETGQPVEITPLYDSVPSYEVRVKTEEPQYVFVLDSPGVYKIAAESMSPAEIPDGGASITVTPYVGNYNATIALLAGLI